MFTAPVLMPSQRTLDTPDLAFSSHTPDGWPLLQGSTLLAPSFSLPPTGTASTTSSVPQQGVLVSDTKGGALEASESKTGNVGTNMHPRSLPPCSL